MWVFTKEDKSKYGFATTILCIIFAFLIGYSLIILHNAVVQLLKP